MLVTVSVLVLFKLGKAGSIGEQNLKEWNLAWMDGLGKDRRIGRFVVFDSFASLWPKGQRRTDRLLSHQRGRWKSLESEWTHCCAYPLSKKSCFYLVIIFSSCVCLLAVTLGFRHLPFDFLGMLGRAFGPFGFQMSPAPLLASPCSSLLAY